MARADRPLTTRRALTTTLLTLALLTAALFPLSGFGRGHLRIKNGVVLSIRQGSVDLFIWDPSYYRVDYHPGFSCELEGFRLDLWPRLHLGGPPAGYALPGEHQWVVSIPLWMISLALAASWWAARRAGWHRHAWECPRCGYDLRGLPQGPCPECGRSTPRRL